MGTWRHPAEYVKAILAFLVPFAGAVITALQTGNDGITAEEWLWAGATALVTFGLVFSVPNRPPAVPTPE